jgi:hypothetical protein
MHAGHELVRVQQHDARSSYVQGACACEPSYLDIGLWKPEGHSDTRPRVLTRRIRSH